MYQNAFNGRDLVEELSELKVSTHLHCEMLPTLTNSIKYEKGKGKQEAQRDIKPSKLIDWWRLCRYGKY